MTLKINLDGTGGAIVINEQMGKLSYVQNVLGTELDLRYEALRLLVPRIFGKNDSYEVCQWSPIKALEYSVQRIFIVVHKEIEQDAAWTRARLEFSDLAHSVLNWEILPIVYDSMSPPVGDEFSLLVFETLHAEWRTVQGSTLLVRPDALTKAIGATRPDERDVEAVCALAKTAYASKDYSKKRFASFAEYAIKNPVASVLRRAASFHQCAIDGAQLALRIEEAVARQKPFSFVRVGEGEGCFLSYEKYLPRRDGTHEVFGVCAKDIYRIWFDRNIHESPIADIEKIRMFFTKSLGTADIIGVPTQQRVIYEYAHFITDMKKHGHSRGYVGISEILLHLQCAQQSGELQSVEFTDCDIARPLYEWQDWSKALAGTLPKIISGCADVTLVTCHSKLSASLERALGLKNSRTILIPPERGRVKGEGTLQGDHWSDYFDQVNAKLSRDPGRIVLVAAGFLGKAYCATAKSAGAVAVDIGSLADYWVGANTREKNSWAIPSPFDI